MLQFCNNENIVSCVACLYLANQVHLTVSGNFHYEKAIEIIQTVHTMHLIYGVIYFCVIRFISDCPR